MCCYKSPKKTVKKSPKKTVKKSLKIYKPDLSKGDCFERSKVMLNPYQRKVVDHMMKNRGLIIVHGTGMGKTMTAVTTSMCLLDKYQEKKVLVVTPKSLQDNFKKEIVKYGGVANDPRFIFKTYGEMLNMYKNKNDKTITKNPIICKDTILILDEAHNLRTTIKLGIKGLEGKLSDIMVKCAKNAFKVMCLTATPFVNNEYDLLNLLNIVSKEEITKKEFTNALKNDILFDKLFECKVSVISKGIDDPNYPKNYHNDISLTMDNDFYKEYMKLENKEKIFFNASNPTVFLNGMRRGLLAIKLTEGPKMKYAINKAIEKGFNGKHKKTVIFTNFLYQGINILKDGLDMNGVKYKEVSGKKTQSERNQAVKDFNSGKITTLLITKAGAEGLDLKETRQLIILDPVWNSATEDQIIGRAIRFKSHEELPENQRVVDVYRLFLSKPFFSTGIKSSDDIMKKLIEKKRKKMNNFIEILKKLGIEKNKCI